MALPPQDPMQDSAVFSAWKGIKNTATRERLAPDELEVALNVDLDDLGQLHRRRGRTLRSAGNFHSIWTSSRGLYGVKNGVLGHILPDYTHIPIKSGITDDLLAYVEVGDTIYYSSATCSGKILRDDTHADWGTKTPENTWLSPVVNPTATLERVGGKLIGPPPMATWLAYLNGRIYLANGSTLWATELYLYDYVDKTRNYFQFEAPITGIGNGTDGLYVGTETNVWYLTGPLAEMHRTLLMNYGMLPGSLISIPAELLKSETEGRDQSKNANIFMTNWGVIAAFDGGVCNNLTQDTVLFPQATSVAPLFRRQDGVNQYVAVLNSGGTPSSTARIGDYVDAEIRRFQGV